MPLYIPVIQRLVRHNTSREQLTSSYATLYPCNPQTGPLQHESGTAYLIICHFISLQSTDWSVITRVGDSLPHHMPLYIHVIHRLVRHNTSWGQLTSSYDTLYPCNPQTGPLQHESGTAYLIICHFISLHSTEWSITTRVRDSLPHHMPLYPCNPHTGPSQHKSRTAYLIICHFISLQSIHRSITTHAGNSLPHHMPLYIPVIHKLVCHNMSRGQLISSYATLYPCNPHRGPSQHKSGTAYLIICHCISL